MRTSVLVLAIASSFAACGSSESQNGAGPASQGGAAGAAGASGAGGSTGAGTGGIAAGSGGSTQAGAGGIAPGSGGTTPWDAGGAFGGSGGTGGVDRGGAGGTTAAVDAGTDASVPNDTTHFPKVAALYKGTFAAPPALTSTDQTTDAPLLGNGDLGVAVLNNVDAMTFILHKNEFWSLADARVKAMARLSLAIPDMAGASYAMTEDIGPAEVNGTFALSGNTIRTKTWVQADDTTTNRVLTQLAYTGTGTKNVTVSLAVGTGNGLPATPGASADTLYLDVRGDNADTVGGQQTVRVRVATRVVGATATVANNKLSFALAAGRTVTLSTSVLSNYDAADFQAKAVSAVAAQTSAEIDSLASAHRAWWDAFWNKSFVEIPDKLIEKQYYAGLYLLASASRTGETPPGLWANWVIKDPAWNGDFTLNYNYEAPFYLAGPTNHTELADSYDKPIIDWLPKAQALATTRGWTGAYYRVHIGPLPNGSADGNEWNQKSCGAFAASVMLMHYYYGGRDAAYAKKIYEVVKQVAIFWQSYLVLDGARYVIKDDAQHEGDPNPQVNGIMSLGLVRFLLEGAIDLSTDLSLDDTSRTAWQERLSKLSPYPTFQKNNKTVFRYTEVGRDWNDGNAIGIQHIYPASQIGLGSDPAMLQIAKDMVDVMGRWNDDNGTNTFYPAAVRVGYDPASILSHLKSWIQGHTYPNLHIHTGGGGLENVNTVPSTIAEMLLQSFESKLRVFPNWPAATEARFGDLRAYGALLVSSDVRKAGVSYVRIVSEKGRPCTLVNPWAGKTVRVYRNGVDAGTLTGANLAITTAEGEVIHLAPDGTTLQAILDAMKVAVGGA
jgi:alpha-L-fucosidase 2